MKKWILVCGVSIGALVSPARVLYAYEGGRTQPHTHQSLNSGGSSLFVGQITATSMTVTGARFSVGQSSFVVNNGGIGLGVGTPLAPIHITPLSGVDAGVIIASRTLTSGAKTEGVGFLMTGYEGTTWRPTAHGQGNINIPGGWSLDNMVGQNTAMAFVQDPTYGARMAFGIGVTNVPTLYQILLSTNGALPVAVGSIFLALQQAQFQMPATFVSSVSVNNVIRGYVSGGTNVIISSASSTPGIALWSNGPSGSRNFGMYTNYSVNGDFVIVPSANAGGDPFGQAQALHISTGSQIGLKTSVSAGQQLSYCAGGTFAGNVCRGGACICTGGTATALGIYVP